jgi:hypothetical protein
MRETAQTTCAALHRGLHTARRKEARHAGPDRLLHTLRRRPHLAWRPAPARPSSPKTPATARCRCPSSYRIGLGRSSSGTASLPVTQVSPVPGTSQRSDAAVPTRESAPGLRRPAHRRERAANHLRHPRRALRRRAGRRAATFATVPRLRPVDAPRVRGHPTSVDLRPGCLAFHPDLLS